jgi:hypothetical protein
MTTTAENQTIISKLEEIQINQILKLKETVILQTNQILKLEEMIQIQCINTSQLDLLLQYKAYNLKYKNSEQT